jgi:hypothetical protein
MWMRFRNLSYKPTAIRPSSGAVAAQWSMALANRGPVIITETSLSFLEIQRLMRATILRIQRNPRHPSNKISLEAHLGGPIIKDKLFWFGDYQGTSIRNPLTWVSAIPDLAERTGDFSGASEPIIYDPSTGLPFPGNIIPAGRIDPISQAFMNLYPTPNQPGQGNNFVISPIEQDRIDQGDGRIDYNPSQEDRFYVRYSMSARKDVRPAPLPGLANGGDSSTGIGYEDTQGASVGYTRTFTPRTVNEIRVGFNHVHIRRGLPVDGTVLPADDLRVPGVPDDPRVNGLTLFAPSGGFRRLGDPRFAPTLLASQERQVNDVLTLVRGPHIIKVGGAFLFANNGPVLTHSPGT